MTVPVSDLLAAPPTPHRRRRWVLVTVGLVVAVVAGLALVVGANLWSQSRSVPTFPSLVDHPDKSLHGTVAYYANDTGCIRLAAASGLSSRTLWCLPKEKLSTWQRVGKPAGPQLVWRAGFLLEVTMFRFTPGPGKGQALSPGWQRVIDVRTGRVVATPSSQVPATPNTTSEATVDPTGRRVNYTIDGGSGRATVTLSDDAGSRTLLSVRGPGMYGYRFGPVFWAPNWQWIAASDDGRILVITPGNPSVTRVLATGTGGGAGGGTAGPAFAVTGADLLSHVG